MVRCTLEVVSLQVVKWCKEGTVKGGDFILLYGKVSEPALIIIFSSVVGSVRLIKHLVMFV
jgi:hypothetical protein